MQTMPLSDLFMPKKPRGTSRSQFGVALYTIQFPGVSCPRPDVCLAKAYTGWDRIFAAVPSETAERARSLRKRGTFNLPVPEFAEYFGQRQPRPENPCGFLYPPGTRAGSLLLVFEEEPSADLIWPAGGRGLIVSERLKELIESLQATGLTFHQSQTCIVHRPDLKVSDDVSRIDELGPEARPGLRQFYELEVVSPPIDCGLRFKVDCPHCGHEVHDCTEVRIEAPISVESDRAIFWIHGLGRPVFSLTMVDALRREDFQAFEIESAEQIVQSICRSNG